MKKDVVITIARQYGSGGKMIGEMLAKELGVKAYDRAIIRLASEESGIAEALFGQVDENLKRTLRDKIKGTSYDQKLLTPESSKFTSNDNLFSYQAKIIRHLADEGSCVFIGRCADYVLKDRDNVVRLYIYADEDFKLKRSLELNSMSVSEMKKFMNNIDKHRGEFYKYYTGNDWDDAKNYDLCINSGVLDFDQIIEMIKSYIQIRWPEE